MLSGINGATSGSGAETVTSLLSSLFSGDGSLSNGSSGTTNTSTASISQSSHCTATWSNCNPVIPPNFSKW